MFTNIQLVQFYEANTLDSRLLARHQGVLDRLRSEIQATVGIGADAPPPTRNDLRKMTYLNLVIKEGIQRTPYRIGNCGSQESDL